MVKSLTLRIIDIFQYNFKGQIRKSVQPYFNFFENNNTWTKLTTIKIKDKFLLKIVPL
jgi:hypothetical protein